MRVMLLLIIIHKRQPSYFDDLCARCELQALRRWSGTSLARCLGAAGDGGHSWCHVTATHTQRAHRIPSTSTSRSTIHGLLQCKG